MLSLPRAFSVFLCSLALLLPSLANAAITGEQKQTFGDYEVHYMGLTSSFLTPEVTAAYSIERSRSVGFLSISILHNQADQPMPVPVTGKVTGIIKNLIGQSRELEFKEIKETGSVYYISTFQIDNKDMYHLQLKVQPSGEARVFDVKFSQRFYHEK